MCYDVTVEHIRSVRRSDANIRYTVVQTRISAVAERSRALRVVENFAKLL